MAKSSNARLWMLRALAMAFMGASIYIAWYTIAAGKPRDFWQDKLNPERANLQAFDGEFEDQDGKRVRLSDFAGRATIATFVFVNCNMSCPIIINDLRLFEKETPKFAEQGNFLIFTFEDHRGKSGDLKGFLAKYRIAGAHWRVLTSDAATIKRLADAYALQYQKTAEGRLVYAHTNVFIVADEKGKVRREFRGIENNKAKFFDDVRKVL